MNHRFFRHLGILGCIFGACTAAGCCSYSRAAAEKYIKEGESQWAESVSSGDASVLKRILAEDFVWIYPDGTRILWTKAEAVADAAAGPGDFVSDHVDDVRVRFFGNTALAQGSESWVRKTKAGKIIQGQFVWSDVWLRRQGQWQIVQAQDEAIGVRESAPNAP